MVVVIRSSGLVSIVVDFLVDLGSPSVLSYYWGFGSLLGLFLGVQVVSGIFLSANYTGDVGLAFDVLVHLVRDVKGGWMIRGFHSNGASLFFVLLYLHLGRGIFYASYFLIEVWYSGVTVLIVSMAVAFLGYVLPWGQMSFWAATVITNLLSAIPYVGIVLVEWVWGGFAVGGPTLTRFFVFHFIFSFFIVLLVVFHLYFLHGCGSSNVLGVGMTIDSIVFHPHYIVSDVVGVVFLLWLLFFIIVFVPFMLMDPENFIKANLLVTPEHIQPEWYFLFAYAILRSVPSSVGGVVALVLSLVILYLLPLMSFSCFDVIGGFYIGSWVFWFLVVDWVLLTWGGSCVVDPPYIFISQVCSFLYFILFFVLCFGYKMKG